MKFSIFVLASSLLWSVSVSGLRLVHRDVGDITLAYLPRYPAYGLMEDKHPGCYIKR